MPSLPKQIEQTSEHSPSALGITRQDSIITTFGQIKDISTDMIDNHAADKGPELALEDLRRCCSSRFEKVLSAVKPEPKVVAVVGGIVVVVYHGAIALYTNVSITSPTGG